MTHNASSNKDMILVAMPWLVLNRTPIQLGILQPVVEQAGFSIGTRSFFLSAIEHFAAGTAHLPPGERITIDDYQEIVYRYYDVALGDWIFVVPPYHQNTAAEDEEYLAYLRLKKVPEAMIAKALRIRELVPNFLESCAANVLAASPRVVGFTTCFNQNVASLALAKILKERNPDLHIVFGGGNCDGDMGPALHRAFPWVDTVVRGEGEHVLPKLLRNIFADEPILPQPGLCYRNADGASIVVPLDGGQMIEMDDVPVPKYDEFFEQLDRSPLREQLSPKMLVLFESARGCWWGEKSHCTFCGLNGSSMKFRSKTASRVAAELHEMANKYKRVDFEAVDNIIDLDYIDDGFLPTMAAYRRKGYDFKMHYETKSNLKKRQVRAMSDAGIKSIQPGIESISNPILKLMKKGVTGLQNIRLLKWAAQFDIFVSWNVIYGFPGEPGSEYDRMADVMQSLTHFCPPNIGPLTTVRFSPYHQNPRGYGVKLTPAPHYRLIYPFEHASLEDIAYDFAHTYDDGRTPSSYMTNIKAFAKQWRESHKKGASSLTYRRGPGFVVISDRRSNLEASDYHLEEREADIYLLCDAGATPMAIWKALQKKGSSSLAVEEVKAFLDALVEARLVYEEDGLYLSLAVPTNVEAEEFEIEAQENEPLPMLVQIGPASRPVISTGAGVQPATHV
jgi:ribosomal peptide maturation radical SAM protein 1